MEIYLNVILIGSPYTSDDSVRGESITRSEYNEPIFLCVPSRHVIVTIPNLITRFRADEWPLN